jgi:hypothetical protein
MAVMAPRRKLFVTVAVLPLLSAAAWYGWSRFKGRFLSPVPVVKHAASNTLVTITRET